MKEEIIPNLERIRDQLKPNADYWQKWILEHINTPDKINLKIENGEIIFEKIDFVRQYIVLQHINIMFAKYSAGHEIESLKENWYEAVELMDQCWISGHSKAVYGKNFTVYDEYILSEYHDMLQMISIGYLLNVDKDKFKILANILDRDCVKDLLYEFIIKAMLLDRKPIQEESYTRFFIAPKAYRSLRQAILEPDISLASKLTSNFVRKEWYNNHKSCGWVGSHTNPLDVYFGYWCFEAAAVTKIKGLDDINYRDWKYYPKDML